MHHVNCAESIAGGQNAIEGAGRTAPLDVSQHYRASLESRALFNFARQNVCDATKFGMSEFVLPHVLHDRGSGTGFRSKLGAFGDNDDGEITSSLMSLANRFRNFVDVEWALRNQDR